MRGTILRATGIVIAVLLCMVACHAWDNRNPADGHWHEFTPAWWTLVVVFTGLLIYAARKRN